MGKFRIWFAILVVASLSSCGGGGGGGSAPVATTAVSGDVTPGTSLPAGQPVIGTATDMVLAPSAPQTTFPAIAQTLDYVLDVTQLPSIKISTATFARPIDTVATFVPVMDSTAFPGDATLGQPNAINIQTGGGVLLGPVNTQMGTDTLGGQPAFTVKNVSPSNVIAGYVEPVSAANPAGYQYQTIGSWINAANAPSIVEGSFSAGIPTNAGTLLGAGSGTYSGIVQGTWMQATTRERYDVVATAHVTIDYAARTVTFGTVGSTALSENAATGAPHSSTPDLNMSGTLTYAAGSNTFSGVVTSANGMSGNVTGRMYGPALIVAGGGKPIGAPPEIGGTFALKLPGIGAILGAFSGN